MPERAAVFQSVQIGPETTPGTAVAASKRLLCTSVMPEPKVPIGPYRPVGQKFPTVVSIGKEHTEARVEGVLCYNDLTYLLASLLKDATPTGGGADKTWTFVSLPGSADTIKTFTVEVGSSVRAEKFAYAVCSDLSIRANQQESTLSGRMIGRALTEGITLTATPTDITQVVVQPKTWDVSIGASTGALTALTRCLEFEWSMSNRHRPVFAFDSAQGSFAALVEGAPEMSARVVLQHDSAASAFMTQLRAGTQYFCRFLATGPSLGASNYSLRITFPFFFLESPRSDQDDQYVTTYQLQPSYESVLTSAVEIVLVNSLTAL